MNEYIEALSPIISRVRTDVTALKKDGRTYWTKEALTETNLNEHLSNRGARGVWGDDIESIHTLQEIFGYLLTTDTTQQKMFLLKGPKRSGKL